MHIKRIAAVVIFLFSSPIGFLFGQSTAPGKSPVVSGDVVSLGDNKIVVKTVTGQVEVAISEKTVYKRVSAEKPDFKTATPASYSDVAVGDKLTATGILATDGSPLPAKTVFLMTKSDIAQKLTKESEQWKTRGITGRVVSVDAPANQIQVEMRSMMGSTKVTVTPKEKAKFLRYAEDSIRYDEAKSSSLAEVKAGDMFRALGDRGPDGTTFAAEEIITGAFQTIAGTVKSVDVEKKEILIKNLQSGKDVTVVISEASILKTFPPEMAQRLASGPMGGGIRPSGQGGAAPQPPAPSGGQAQSPGMGRGGMGPGRGGLDDMFERLPDITSTELKPGDMIAFSSTKGANVDRLKAIKLVAGVEPFIRMAQATTSSQRGQGVQGGFTIPGLDGGGF